MGDLERRKAVYEGDLPSSPEGLAEAEEDVSPERRAQAVRNLNRMRAQDFVSFPAGGLEPLREVKDLGTGEWTDQVRRLTRPPLPPLGTEPEVDDEF